MAESLTPDEIGMLEHVRRFDTYEWSDEINKAAADELERRGLLYSVCNRDGDPTGEMRITDAGITALAEHATAERFAELDRLENATFDPTFRQIAELVAIVRELHRRVVELEIRS